jgi:hypothetical protein
MVYRARWEARRRQPCPGYHDGPGLRSSPGFNRSSCGREVLRAASRLKAPRSKAESPCALPNLRSLSQWGHCHLAVRSQTPPGDLPLGPSAASRKTVVPTRELRKRRVVDTRRELELLSDLQARDTSFDGSCRTSANQAPPGDQVKGPGCGRDLSLANLLFMGPCGCSQRQ